MTILYKNGLVVCPSCGVGSNLIPDYLSGKGTAVQQRLSYCGHCADFDGIVVSPIVLWSYPNGLACIKYQDVEEKWIK